MAKKKHRHTGAFFTGSLLGGLIGAALTLWKTPRSGAELRRSFGGGTSDNASGTTTVVTTSAGEQRFSNPILGFVERVSAPIVGVKLGKLARDDPHAESTVSARTSAADARPPDSEPAEFVPREPEHGAATAIRNTPDMSPAGVDPVADEPVRVQTGTAGEPANQSAVTSSEPAAGRGVEPPASPDREPTAPAAINPDEEVTHDAEAGSEAPVATTEDLTSPAPEYVDRFEEGRRREQAAPEDIEVDFPDTPRRDTTGSSSIS